MRPGWLALRPDWLGLRPAWLALGPSRGERMDGRMDGRKDGRMDGWMDGWTDGRTVGWTDVRTENLPILQDFVPYRGRWPKMDSRSEDSKAAHGLELAEYSKPVAKRHHMVSGTLAPLNTVF